MNQTTIPIKGMHCRSCELLIEDELKKIPGVSKVEVSHLRGEAIVSHASPNISDSRIAGAIKRAGYEIGRDETKPFFSTNIEEYKETLVAAAIVLLIFFIASQMGLTGMLGGETLAPSSIPLIFLIGLTAGMSTCMALIGGLVLGISAMHAKQNPGAGTSEKFRPHLAFNAGRVVSYFILGGLIGILGGVFQFSSSILGVLTLGIGLIMIVFGVQLTGLFPRLASMSLTLPGSIGKKLGVSIAKSSQYSDASSAFAGAATFFLPCGFTQTMQLFAMSTGSFSKGALVMGVFALGTMPGLLGVGGLSSFLKGANARMFYKFAGVIVLFFAITNISRGLNLTGWKSVFAFNNETIEQSNNVKKTNQQEKINNKQKTANPGQEQIITAVFNGGYDLQPNNFTVKVGSPVKFVVDAKVNGSGCMSAMMIPGLVNRPTYLQAGKKIEFAFTPTKKGTYQITCAMGVPWGDITVKE